MKMFLKKHKVAVAIVCTLLFLYLAGVLLFLWIALPNTIIDGNNRGFQSIQGILESPATTSTLEFQGRNQEKMALKAADIHYTKTVKEGQTFHQNPFSWPIHFFVSREFPVQYDVHYDAALLKQKIEEGGFELNGKEPVNATVVVDHQKAHIQKEQLGTKVKYDALEKEIFDAFQKHYDQPQVTLSLTDIYYEPTIRSDNAKLQKQLEATEKVVQPIFSFDFSDRKPTLEGKELAQLYDVQEDGSLKLNEEHLKQWVQQLAKETDTYGTTRTFQATNFGPVQVPPGIYGWKMDVDKTVAEVKKAIEAGKSDTLTPEYSVYGMDRGTNDIGNTYIEIDLSRQHLWAYKDGELLLDSPVISGRVQGGHTTPVGVNCIWSREEGAELVGQNFDSTTEYHTPVRYWMPINYTGVGLHDASWQPAFGGDIYIYGGSHGCVNLPPSVAASLFENYDVLTPVVVYESSTDYSSPESSY